MKKTNKKPRHLVAKPQKNERTLHYWQPTKKLRENGFLPRRLSDDLMTALKEAEALNIEVDQWRLKEKNDSPKRLTKASTLSNVISVYRKDPLFTEKAHATQRIYGQCLDRIEKWAGDQEINSIPRSAIIDFHRTLYEKKPAFANAIGRMMRIVFEYAYDRGIIESNPARRIKMHVRPPRDQIWSPVDQESFLKAANEMGYPSMALAVLLAICTGQRQGDILKLCWSQCDHTEIRLRQNKTKRWVSVPILPELKTKLDKAPRKNEFVVVCESTGRPYRPDHFRHLFREIANKAKIGDLQFRDLRRTAVVRLAEAGVSIAGITAISGHDITHCEGILETYMPRSSEMAREAMAQFENYRNRKGLEQTKPKSWKKSRK